MQFDFYVRSDGVWNKVWRTNNQAKAAQIQMELEQYRPIAVTCQLEGLNVIGLRVHRDKGSCHNPPAIDPYYDHAS